MRSNLFKLANVVILFRLGCHQGPELLDLFASDVKQAGSFRSVEPLMQACPEVITAKIFLLEIKLRKRMSAVDNRFDSFCARQPADRFDRRDLACDVYLM